jgi:hypothetical protein
MKAVFWLLVATVVCAGAAFWFVTSQTGTSRPEPDAVAAAPETGKAAAGAETATPEHMPNLFAAADQGVRFANHRAVSAWTGPNVIAVLTGVSPFRQGVHARGQSVPPAYDLLTEGLARTGWDVGGVQAFMRIELFRNLGFNFEPGVDLIYGGNGNEATGDVFVDMENAEGLWFDDSLTGNDGANLLQGGDGSDWLNGRAGDDHLVGGNGSDALMGGAGDDLFIFADGHGADRVMDFTAGAGSPDRLGLRDVTAVSDLGELLAASTQSGADTVLDFGGGDTITLVGVDRGALHADDFLF